MQVKKGHVVLPSVQKRGFMPVGNRNQILTRNGIYLSLEVTMFSHQLIMNHPLGILTVLNPVQDFRHTIKMLWKLHASRANLLVTTVIKEISTEKNELCLVKRAKERMELF